MPLNQSLSSPSPALLNRRVALALTAMMVIVLISELGIGVSAFLDYRGQKPDLYHKQNLRLLAGSITGILLSVSMIIQWWARRRWLKITGSVLLILCFLSLFWSTYLTM